MQEWTCAVCFRTIDCSCPPAAGDRTGSTPALSVRIACSGLSRTPGSAPPEDTLWIQCLLNVPAATDTMKWTAAVQRGQTVHIRLGRRSPYLSITDDYGEEVWGPLRPLFGMMASFGGVIVSVFGLGVGAALTVGFPLVAHFGSVTWKHRGSQYEVQGPARYPVALMVGIGSMASALSVLALSCTFLTLGTTTSLLQAVVHPVAGFLGRSRGGPSSPYTGLQLARQSSSRDSTALGGKDVAQRSVLPRSVGTHAHVIRTAGKPQHHSRSLAPRPERGIDL